MVNWAWFAGEEGAAASGLGEGGWRRALTGPGASLLSAAIYFITLRASTFGNPWSELPFAAKTPIGRGNVIYTELRTLQWREIERGKEGGREEGNGKKMYRRAKKQRIVSFLLVVDTSFLPTFRHSLPSASSTSWQVWSDFPFDCLLIYEATNLDGCEITSPICSCVCVRAMYARACSVMQIVNEEITK